MSDERELQKLRDAFPGIWVREDGAFRYEPFGIYWQPGDVESDLSEVPGAYPAPNVDGRVRINGGDYGHGTAKLKLSQIQVLADYITAIDSSLAAARIKAERESADLDKAISALTPVSEGKGDALLADQQDTPPQSNAQASETDAAPSFDEIENEALRIARTQGMNARLRGEDSNSNPYEVFSTRSNAWSDGWHSEAPTADERTSVVTDHDRVEQTNTDTVAAVEIPEGFIPWSGEDVFTPTPDSDDKTYSVEVLYRDGTRNINKAWTFVWGWKDNAESSSNIIAYKVISEPAEASEPAEIISTLTGDPAIEPESGLHGEPLPVGWVDNPGHQPVADNVFVDVMLYPGFAVFERLEAGTQMWDAPTTGKHISHYRISEAPAEAEATETPSELDSQAEPQTKSEQSDNPLEEKFNALRDGGPAGFWAVARGLTKIEELA